MPIARSQRHRLLTLGRTEICDRGGPSVPLSAREAGLLGFICSRPLQRVHRNEAVELLWGHSDVRRGRHSLSQLLYSLRSRSDAVRAIGDFVEAPEVSWDVNELNQAHLRTDNQAVLGLYGGRFLPNADVGSPEFMDWRDEVQLATASCVAKALEEQSYLAGRDNLKEIERVAVEILAVHPEMLEAQIALIEAAIQTGSIRRAEQLHAKFTGLQAAIPPFSHFSSKVAIPIRSKQVSFAGRESELARLQLEWDQVKLGKGACVILFGEAGIGKTRLADQFLRRCALSGARVWLGECCAATQRLSYSVARDLYRDNMASMNSLAREKVDAAFRGIDASTQTTVEETRHKLTEAFTVAAETTSVDKPLIIFIDDAQWADSYTALLLSYWAHRLRSQKVMLLLAVRTHEAHELPEWITADLARASDIYLGPLGIEPARKIVDAFEAGCDVKILAQHRDSVLWLSAGRPFLLLEALSARLADATSATTSLLTPTAESVLRRRFKDLTSPAQQVADFLAVWAKDASQWAIQAACGLKEYEVADALDLLTHRGIAHFENGHARFVHDLMREAAYRLMGPSRQASMHRRSAELAAQAGEPAGLIAQHYAAAGNAEEAGDYAMRAALCAESAQMYPDFEFYCRLAMSRGTSPHAAAAAALLADHLLQVGRTSEISAILPAIADSGFGGWYRSVYEFEQSLGTDAFSASDLVTMARSIIHATPLRRTKGAVSIVGNLLDIALDAGVPEFGMTLLTSLDEDNVEQNLSDSHLQLLALRIVWSTRTLGISQAMANAEELTRQLLQTHSPSTRALCYYALGTLLLLAGRVDQSLQAFDLACAEADAAGDIRRQQALYINRGVALAEAGMFQAARALLEKALTSNSIHVRIRAYTNLAIVHYEMGLDSLAIDAAEAGLSMNELYKSAELERIGLSVLGLAALRNDSRHTANECYRRLSEHDPDQGTFEDPSYTVMFSAEYVAAAGDAAQAFNLLEKASARVASSHTLASLRIQLVAARFAAKTDRDRAYNIAGHVALKAEALSASHLAVRAADLKRSLRSHF
jgi:tetratricopeptide (TPR) repeat protein/DNA-binding SARP family transcriptional activator